jgi:hypothetical protein
LCFCVHQVIYKAKVVISLIKSIHLSDYTTIQQCTIIIYSTVNEAAYVHH